MEEINSADPTADPISIARCRELLGDEAVGLSAEEVARVWRRADAMAHVLIEVFLQKSLDGALALAGEHEDLVSVRERI